MKQAGLLFTIGLPIICLSLTSSCVLLPSIQPQQRNANFSKLSQNSNSVYGKIINNLDGDLFELDADKTSVFDDIAPEIDNLKADLLTDTAKLLAGMNIGDRSELALLKDTDFWSEHRNLLSSAWSKLEVEKLFLMRKWSQQELGDIDSSNGTIFYPFSNANFIQVYTLFPQAKEYVLIGLEPVGTVANLAYLSAAQQARQLKQIRTYLDNIFPTDYFDDRYIGNFQTIQALPVLYVFLAKTNNRIIDVEYMGIDADGQTQQFQQGMISGVKITFVTQGDSRPRLLYYFSADLSNEGMEKNPELIKFIDNRSELVTYLEKAAYLMYFDSFSQIKNLILSRSYSLLQDDSGLPLSDFESERWNLQFYGNYVQPIELFKNKYQPELWNIYHSHNNIQPLTFSMGYQSEVEQSNLMLATTKPQS